MTSTDSVYPSPFAEMKCVGMVWSQKIVFATWFASGSMYVHGIQMLPFTPMTEYYLPYSWVKEEYPVLYSTYNTSLPVPTDPWIGFMIADQAVIDRDGAWKNMLTMKSYDNGASATNMLWWVATRPVHSDEKEMPEADE